MSLGFKRLNLALFGILLVVCPMRKHSLTTNFSKGEKKEPTDDTSKDVYSLLAEHVSGISH